MVPVDKTPPVRPRFQQTAEKAGAVILVGGLIFGLVYALNQNRPLDLAFMGRTYPTLLEGAALTLGITVLSYLTGMGLGFVFGWMRTSKWRPLRGISGGWVEAIRGTPLFVQLLFLFSVLSFYVPTVPSRLAITAFLVLSLNTSAYQAEIFRAGLQSVAAGQVEAAQSVGLGYWGAMRTVILPQAIRLVVPPLTNEFIALLKASSLLFFIGFRELTYQGRILSFGGNLLEVYTMVILIYLVLTVPLAKAVSWLERRYEIPGLGFRPERGARRERAGRTLAPVRSEAARVLGVDIATLRALSSRMRRRTGRDPSRRGSKAALRPT